MLELWRKKHFFVCRTCPKPDDETYKQSIVKTEMRRNIFLKENNDVYLCLKQMRQHFQLH